jgi:hypothetical protein
MTEAQQFISDLEYRRHRLMLRLPEYQQGYEDACLAAVACPGVATQQRAHGAKVDWMRLMEHIEFYDVALVAARRRRALTWRDQWKKITGTEFST